ncbi:hypothetical protein [Streptomyces sp. BPTC-684]|uniref:hypothetical protein n=1 Tax=Streptomyces sp. BPTC-684 TaxID=3043734 RepID=UPI0024B080C2|nr:hypothetical protein [Streptomyces sp. BPTC-684]WHM37514.1 hypothetical protein QIY60_11740 [Streptomyces sp. BPTC-684]
MTEMTLTAGRNRPRRRRAHFAAAIALTALTALISTTGCTAMQDDGLDYTPQKMSVKDAKDLIRRQSSVILDASGLRYETSNGSPDVSPCEKVEHGYRVKHFWKAYGPSPEALSAALKRLHEELPKRGWKVYRFEKANSKAQQMQLDVEDMKLHHTVTVEEDFVSRDPAASKWEKAGRDGLFVAVDSPCYVDPEYKTGDQ